jgi:hypothetical protein
MRRAILLAAAVFLPAFATAATLQPGLYRSTSQSPGEKPDTSEDCVTQKDIDDGLSNLGATKDQNCKVQDLKRGSSNVSYRMVCSGSGMTVTQKVKLAYTSDTYDMNLAMTVAGETNTIHVTGKRIGACSK